MINSFLTEKEKSGFIESLFEKHLASWCGIYLNILLTYYGKESLKNSQKDSCFALQASLQRNLYQRRSPLSSLCQACEQSPHKASYHHHPCTDISDQQSRQTGPFPHGVVSLSSPINHHRLNTNPQLHLIRGASYFRKICHSYHPAKNFDKSIKESWMRWVFKGWNDQNLFLFFKCLFALLWFTYLSSFFETDSIYSFLDCTTSSSIRELSFSCCCID